MLITFVSQQYVQNLLVMLRLSGRENLASQFQLDLCPATKMCNVFSNRGWKHHQVLVSIQEQWQDAAVCGRALRIDQFITPKWLHTALRISFNSSCFLGEALYTHVVCFYSNSYKKRFCAHLYYFFMEISVQFQSSFLFGLFVSWYLVFLFFFCIFLILILYQMYS